MVYLPALPDKNDPYAWEGATIASLGSEFPADASKALTSVVSRLEGGGKITAEEFLQVSFVLDRLSVFFKAAASLQHSPWLKARGDEAQP